MNQIALLSKFKLWSSEAEHATSMSQKLPAIPELAWKKHGGGISRALTLQTGNADIFVYKQ